MAKPCRRCICAATAASERPECGRQVGRRPKPRKERRRWIVAPSSARWGVCAGKVVGRSLPRRQPHQEGVAETWVSAEMGASETPLAPTREETSSLQKSAAPDAETLTERGHFVLQIPGHTKEPRHSASRVPPDSYRPRNRRAPTTCARAVGESSLMRSKPSECIAEAFSAY
jgi:hypothetical protein